MGSRRKPLVGIIHSASSKTTTTGDDLAVYLGVCLQLGGNVLALLFTICIVSSIKWYHTAVLVTDSRI